MPPTPSEYTTAVMKLVESGNVRWDEPDVAKVLGDAVRKQLPYVNHQQQSFDPSKSLACPVGAINKAGAGQYTADL